MNDSPLRVLVVEDNPDDVALATRALTRAGIQLEAGVAADGDAIRNRLREGGWDVILCDHGLPGMDSLAVLQLLREEGIDAPVILLSGKIGEEAAAAAMRAGAYDYVSKDHLALLPGAVTRALEAAAGRRERKRTEEELRSYASELERANRELAAFAHAASHDLKEPLRMIGSYSQLIAKRYADRLDREGLDFLRFVTEGAQRMNELVNSLVDYTQVGGGELKLAPTDCGKVVRGALSNLRAALADTGAQVHVDRLPTVAGSPALLTRLFQNLVSNAVKFRSEEPPRVSISAVRDGALWRIAVADNGIGIPPELREKVFGLFQRLHPREAYPGTGIGLTVCKRIVERHGGRIWVESGEGRGSTFLFTLPALGQRAETPVGQRLPVRVRRTPSAGATAGLHRGASPDVAPAQPARPSSQAAARPRSPHASRPQPAGPPVNSSHRGTGCTTHPDLLK